MKYKILVALSKQAPGYAWAAGEEVSQADLEKEGVNIAGCLDKKLIEEIGSDAPDKKKVKNGKI